MLIIYHIHKISVSKNIFGNRFFYTDRKDTIKVLLTCKNNEIIVIIDKILIWGDL